MSYKIYYLTVIIIFFSLCPALFPGQENWESLDLKISRIPVLYSAVECADMDFDGDLDLFAGNGNGFLMYFENTGTPASFSFQLKASGLDKNNSFFHIYTTGKSIPRFIDIDNDNDLDLFIGDNSGNIAFYRNDGKIDAPAFVEVKSGKSMNESYSNINVDMGAAPCFADIDNDGDADLFAGNALGFIAYFKNMGTASVPLFSCINSGKSRKDSFAGIQVENYAVPFFTDRDNTGKYDLFIGDLTGRITYYKNMGTTLKYNFKFITNNFAGIRPGGDAVPCFADLDNDNTDELILGNNEGRIMAYKKFVPKKTIAGLLPGKINPEKSKTDASIKYREDEDDGFSFIQAKVRELMNNKDPVEVLNIIYSQPKFTGRFKIEIAEAENQIEKVNEKSRNTSLLFEDAEPYYRKAVEYYIKSQYEKAIPQFDNVLSTLPNHDLSRLYKKRAQNKLIFKKNEKQAAEFYNKSISFYKKDLRSAFSFIQKARELNPDNLLYARVLAQYSNEYFSRMEKGRYEQEIMEARSLIDMEKYNEADNILSGLQEKFPQDEKVTNLINICRKNLSVRYHADNEKIRQKYLQDGDEWFTKNNFTNALKNYESAFRCAPQDTKIKEKIDLTRIKIEKKQNRMLDPQAVKEHFQNGMKFYSLGQYQEAIREWEKVLELDPGHVMAKNNIAKARKMLE